LISLKTIFGVMNVIPLRRYKNWWQNIET